MKNPEFADEIEEILDEMKEVQVTQQGASTGIPNLEAFFHYSQ
jgi:hypothetical protein